MSVQIFDNISFPAIKELRTFVSERPFYTKWKNKETWVPNDGALETVQNNTRSIYRQPYGWDRASTIAYAPLVWDLFTYLNVTLFEKRFILAGVPEEAGGTHMLHRDPDVYKDIPYKGQDFFNYMKKQTGLPPIWLAYANARPKQSMRSIGLSTFPTQNLSPKVLKKVMGTNNTIHRDWPSSKPVEESKGYYTLLYNLNEEWRPTWAGEMITHEDDGPETHVIRPYTIGWSDKIISHKPERCVLMSADQLHRTFDCRLAGKYTTKIVFRVKEISR